MRTILAFALAASLTTAASAAEVSIKLDDAAQNAVGQLPTLLDQCVSGVMLRGDSTVCKSISNFLIALNNETRTAAAKAVADAKAADDAKKAAEVPAKGN
jgi:hypothetical protein